MLKNSLDKPRTVAIIRPDQTRPDQTRPDQTRPDRTRPDQTALSLAIFAAHNFITLQEGALRPWIFPRKWCALFACAGCADGR